MFCVCVCAVVIITAISPSLNSKIDLKKKDNSLSRVPKTNKKNNNKKNPRVCVECLFVYSLSRAAQAHRESSLQRGSAQSWSPRLGYLSQFLPAAR